jgi:GDPmannose 4,6-dehydratase
MARRALITGVTGQDGAYLARLLLDKGYEVYGAIRRAASQTLPRLRELGIADDIRPVTLELSEFSNLLRALEQVRPDEVYNLAAQSFVHTSFEQPIYTGDVGALGVTRVLEAIRAVNPAIRFYQASTSELFGKAQTMPQNERTPFYPRSPYAVAKLYAHWITVNYRESYDLHASAGILFNHESPLRGPEFITRKVTLALARIRHGQQDVLEVGNVEAQRDWGFAGDYVEGMWRMLQQPRAADYVLATGRAFSVGRFIELAADALGFSIGWEGTGKATRGIDRRSGRVLVTINPIHYRPAEVDLLVGDFSKAKESLGWQPTVALPDLVAMMAEADDRRVREGRLML